MKMPMKQGLLTWSPFDPHFLSRSSISSLKPQKTLKPTSYFFKNFASINDPRRNASNIISYLRKYSENGGSQLKIPTIFDLKEIMLSRLPVAVIVANAIMGFLNYGRYGGIVQVPGTRTYSLALYYKLVTPIEETLLLEHFINGDDSFRNSRFKLTPYISK
ncbi:hypothetical protein CASFOL_033409 [Castilleja foliolosa]|uniref:Protein ENHANCED DISEASE RESISTANCE 2 C-terminal domain-containing protein n=1 Tax=Castilleja foliolosa TaxID=1961234 RepID=A0ABD3C0B8_9LAMI